MFFKSRNSEGEAKTTAGAGAKAPAKQASAQSKLSPEQITEIQRRAATSKKLQASFGEIVSLLMRTQDFKNMRLTGLEDLVVPAITTGQFMIAEAQAKESGFTAPVAAILWASVSEEIDQKLSKTNGEPVKLAPKDWKSGDIPWLIIAAGDKRLIKAILQRVQETTLKGRPMKFRALDNIEKAVQTTTPPS